MSPFHNDIQILKDSFDSPKKRYKERKKSRTQTNGIINMKMFPNNKTN